MSRELCSCSTLHTLQAYHTSIVGMQCVQRAMVVPCGLVACTCMLFFFDNVSQNSCITMVFFPLVWGENGGCFGVELNFI